MGDIADDVVVRPLSRTTPASDTPARIERRPGGSAGNTAAWLGFLGVPVRFLGRVGAVDVDRHAQALSALGVDARLSVDPVRPTATIVVMLENGGERSMYVDRGASAEPSTVPTDVWDDVDWLHLTGYSFFDPRVRPVAVSLVDQARTRSVPWSLDPSSAAYLRQAGPDTFRSWTAGADVLFPNADEAALLSGAAQPTAGAAALTSDYETVVVTCAGRGAVAARRDGATAQAAADSMSAVDTTGAGDAFAAGFLSARLAGGSLPDCLARGSAFAALAVARTGGRPG